MRYGENSHQSAAFYVEAQPAPRPASPPRVQLQGKELSYNNIADTDAALECVKSFSEPACVIVKHANPCGVAVVSRRRLGKAYDQAYQTDPTIGLRRHHRLQPRAGRRDRRGHRRAPVRRSDDRPRLQPPRRAKWSPPRPTCAC